MNEYELLTVVNEGGNAVIRRRAADALFPERAAANAVLRTVTGDPASFSDGAAGRAIPTVAAKIEPVQDLHGYDFPWAKGARNLVDPNEVTQDGANTVWIFRNNPYPFWDACLYILSLQGGIAFDELAMIGEDGETVLASVTGGGSVDWLRWMPGATDTGVIRGMIRIRGTGILAADVKAHAQLEIGESAEAVPTDRVPYENACPLSGRTSAAFLHNEERIGVAFPGEAGTVYGGTLDLTDGRLTVTEAAVTRTLAGHAVDSPFARMFNAEYDPVQKYLVFLAHSVNRDKYLTTEFGLVSAPGTVYDPERDGELIAHYGGGDPEGYYTRYFMPNQAPRQLSTFKWTKSDVNPGDVWYSRPWCRYTDGVNTYEAYGKQVRVVAGEDRQFLSPDFELGKIVRSSDYCRNYQLDDLPVSFKDGGAQRSSLIRHAREIAMNNFFMEGTSLYASLPERTADTVENQPIQFCGELEEPLTFRLTPRQVKALAGENILSADCGPVTVTYAADTETVIDGGLAANRAMIDGGLAADRAMIAAEAPDSTAARTYAVGDYLTVGDALYRVTTAIAEGESVQPGINAERTTVGEELSDANAGISELETESTGRINSLKNEFDHMYSFHPAGWEKGGLYTSSGANYTDNTRIRNHEKIGVSTGAYRVACGDGYSFLMYAWDLNGTYVGAYKKDGTFNKVDANWQSVTDFDLTAIPDLTVKITVTRTPSSNAISVEEGNAVTVYKYTDRTLSVENRAADAKAAGDRLNILADKLNILARIADRTYGGRDLTTLFASEIAQYGGDPWAWIKSRITAGNYDGIYVGDYIPYKDTTAANKTRNARILGIDTYRQYGDTAVGHHIDFWGGLWDTKKPINKANYNNGTSESEHPWLASDAYLYANSLAGKVPSAATANPALVSVDYTAGGIWYFLPDALKAQIRTKRFYLEKRYTAGELLTESNAGGWADLGKIWFPTEYEVYGAPVWGGDKYAGIGSAVQYPFFMGNMNRMVFGRADWWLLTPYSGLSTVWCFVGRAGVANRDHASSTYVAAPICFRIA